MKTLLLNPPKYRDGLYMSREEYGIGLVNCDLLPSNILLAAAYLRGMGMHVDALDAETPQLSMDGYDVVVVWACILHSFYEDIELLRRAKREGKGTVLILNDAYDGLEMEAMQRYDFVDAAVRLWEREIVLGKLLASWEQGLNPDFAGVIYRKDGELVDTGQMPYLSDLEHLPCCAGILKEMPLGRYGAVAITTGRGCPMPHPFCLYSRSGLRRRKIEDVVAEMEAASGVGMVLIIDPAMPTTARWRDELCDQLIARKVKVSWRTDAKLSECNSETLGKMKDAGCMGIMLGIETLDEAMKSEVGGGTTAAKLRAGIESISKAGMVPIPVFNVGFPWDSEESLRRIETFLKQVPVPSFILKQVRPWRGTRMYEQFRDLGLLDGDLGIDDYVHSDYPITGTLHLSREELEQWKLRARRSAILNWRYMWRFLLERKWITGRQVRLLLNLVAGRRGGWDQS